VSSLSGRAVKNASLFDGVRGQFLRTWFCVEHGFVHARNLDIARAFFGRKFAVLFIALLPRRFRALTERLCLSCSPQAFRERLDPKLPSLAFLPQYSYVAALPTIMNYEL